MTRWHRLRETTDRGAALVEMAIVTGVLVLLVLGSVEMGFALKDWLGVEAGSRAGARIAAQAGNQPGADCRILETTAGSVRELQGEVQQVWIYKSSPSGSVGISQQYRPARDTDDPAFLVCGTWFRTASAWPEASRINSGENRDWVGVRVVFDHQWLTGFGMFSGSITWQGQTVMRIEPDPTPDL